MNSSGPNEDSIRSRFQQAAQLDGLPSAPAGLHDQLNQARGRARRRAVAGTAGAMAATVAVSVGAYAVGTQLFDPPAGPDVTVNAASSATPSSSATTSAKKVKRYLSPLTYTPVTLAEAQLLQRTGNEVYAKCLKEKKLKEPEHPQWRGLSSVSPHWNIYKLMSQDLSSPLPADANRPVTHVNPLVKGTSNHPGFPDGYEPTGNKELRAYFDRVITDDPSSCEVAVEVALLGSVAAREKQLELRKTYVNTAVAEHQARAKKQQSEFFTCLYNERHPQAPKKVATQKDLGTLLENGITLSSPYDPVTSPRGTSCPLAQDDIQWDEYETNAKLHRHTEQRLAFAHHRDVAKLKPQVVQALMKNKAVMLSNAKALDENR